MSDDATWAGGINTGPNCSGCGKSPPRGYRWSFYCALHGGACGKCKTKAGSVNCPIPHFGGVDDDKMTADTD